jgi:hypothetical protein
MARSIKWVSTNPSQNSRFEIDSFDEPALACYLNNISDPDLILQQNEETADDVFNKVLGAEAYRPEPHVYCCKYHPMLWERCNKIPFWQKAISSVRIFG